MRYALFFGHVTTEKNISYKKMPYGRTPMRRTYTKSTRTYRRTSTKKMPPVPRVKRTTRTYTRKNALAVRSLARDVRYLKMARHGEIQRNLQTLTRPVQPTLTQPVFFVANDIQADNPVSGAAGCPLYQLNAGGTSTIVSNFQRNNNTFWEDQNLDIVDTGSFYLHSLKLTFRINCAPDNNVQISNRRVRIDIFKQRTKALSTPSTLSTINQLPAVAAQTRLQRLARPDQNKWNPVYFELLSSRFCFLNPSKTNATDKGTGAAIKYCSISVPKKYLGKFTQQITDPSPPQDPTGPGYGVSNFPIHQRIWCCVSSDLDNTVPSPGLPDIEITCQRECTFRDSIGSAQL